MGLFKPKPHERRDEGVVLTLPDWPADVADDVDGVDDDAFAAAIAAAREADAQAADAARQAEFAVSA